MKEPLIKSDDQITLFEVKNSLRTTLQIGYYFLSLLWQSFRKGILPVAISVIVFGAIGYYRFTSHKPPYHATILVQYNTSNGATIAEILEKINQLAKSESYSTIASLLKIPGEDATNLISIAPRSLTNNTLNIPDTVNTGNIFKVGFLFRRQDSSTAVIQKAIINYLNNQPFLKKSRAIQQSVEQQKLSIVNKKLRWIDSSSYQFTQIPDSSGKLPAENTSLYALDNLLSEKIAAIHSVSADSAAVTLVDDLTPIIIPVEKSLSRVVLEYAAIGLIIGVVIAFMVTVRKKMRSA